MPREQRRFYKCTAGGQNKISFSDVIARSVAKLREQFRNLRSSSGKRKRNDFERNRGSGIHRKCFQLRAWIVEAAFHVPKRDLFFKSLAAGRACDPASFLSRC